MNLERCLSMIVDYPLDRIHNRTAIPMQDLQRMGRELQLTPWMIVGMMYGPKDLVKMARKRVLQKFAQVRKRKLFYNSNNRWFFQSISKLLTWMGDPQINKALQSLDQAFDVLNGRPNNVALRLAYWKNPNKDLVKQSELNPNRDQCGLIWYAPLIEMKPEAVVRYVNFVTEACKKFEMNNLITLTTVDDLCFDSTIPILFNLQDPKDVQRAWDFYEYLLQEGKKLGFFPYRFNYKSQSQINFQTKKFGLKLINQNRYR